MHKISDAGRLGPLLALLGALALAAVTAPIACDSSSATRPSRQVIESGKAIFRFDTYGDVKFWTDTLHMNTVIQTAVDPTTALAVGLKVDADTLPPAVLQAIETGQVDLHSPATTVALLKLNAVVGLEATV